MTDASYVLVSTPDMLAALTAQMERWPMAVVDVETTPAASPYMPDSKLLGIGLASSDGRDYWFVPGPGHPESPPLPALDDLLTVLSRTPLGNHTVKFDTHVLCQAGMPEPQREMYDFKVMARLFTGREHPKLDLASLASEHLMYTYPPEAKKNRKKLAEMPLDYVAEYCAGRDVYVAQQLYHYFKENLDEYALRLFIEQEVPLTKTLWRMERMGWHVDREYLDQLAGTDGLSGRIGQLVDDLRSQIGGFPGGKQVNPNSNPQVTAYMTAAGIEPTSFSEKTKEPSWPAKTLIATGHPGALAIAQVRSLIQSQTNTLAVVRDCVDAGLDAVHPEYDNAGTVTGRLASRSPNAQNFKKGWLQMGEAGDDLEDALRWDEEGEQREIAIRRLFSPRPGRVVVSIDYRQLEMYVLGHYLRDPFFNQLLAESDFHGAVAEKVWDVHPGDPDFKLVRNKRAKALGFGLVYGLGIENTAIRMGLKEFACTRCGTQQEPVFHASDEEPYWTDHMEFASGRPGVGRNRANKFREEFYARIPTFRPFQQHVRRSLNAQGYIRNFFGRKYEIEAERTYVAVNWLVQGSAGDYVKFTCRRLDDYFRGHGLTDVLFANTHDEVCMDIPRDAIHLINGAVRVMENSPFRVGTLPTDPRASTVSLANLVELEGLKIA